MTVLAGKRILVVEDEAVIAAMIEDMLVELGATVIGPAATISNGLTLAGAGNIDAAVLDVNVRGERIEPVASLLRREIRANRLCIGIWRYGRSHEVDRHRARQTVQTRRSRQGTGASSGSSWGPLPVGVGGNG